MKIQLYNEKQSYTLMKLDAMLQKAEILGSCDFNEFQMYIDKTYEQHYAKDKFQATEFIIDGGHGTGFCIGNVLKYAQRYGKKGSHTDARKDLMKVLHYALIQLHIHDTQEEE